jgi:hypothetical protein
MIINGAFLCNTEIWHGPNCCATLSHCQVRQSSRESITAWYLTHRSHLDDLYVYRARRYLFFYVQNELPPGMKAEAVFPHFIMTQLPTGVVGFIVAALISAGYLPV